MSNHGFHVKMQDDSADLFLFDEIGENFFGGISSAMFAEAMKEAKGKPVINVHINSAGGDVFDGVAIHSLLRNSGSRVVTHVDGLAASIASVVAVAGDEIIMRQGSMMMVHDPWSVVAGTAADLRKTADTLDTIRDNIATLYKNKTKMDIRTVKNLMAAETWLTADEAVEKGFATRVAKDSAAIAAKFDLSKFQNAPAEWLEQQEQAEPIEKRVDPWRLRLRQRWQELAEIVD